VATEAAVQTAVAATATALALRQGTATPTRVANPVATGTPAVVAPVASGTPGARVTPEEAAYVNGVAQVIQEFNRSYMRFGQLLTQPDPENESWQQAFTAELRLWANGADLARNVRSPETLLPVHQRVMEGLDLYQQAALQLTNALQTGDEAGFNQGITSVHQARQAFAQAEARPDLRPRSASPGAVQRWCGALPRAAWHRAGVAPGAGGG
jgi:hypothetical protein